MDKLIKNYINKINFCYYQKGDFGEKDIKDLLNSMEKINSNFEKINKKNKEVKK